MNIEQLSFLKQQDAEKLFAATLFISPVETVSRCGWLDPGDIMETRIRKLWASAKETVGPSTNENDAHEIVTRLAFEHNLAADLAHWSTDLPFIHPPHAYANEIARRQYLTRLSLNVGKLAHAISTLDDTAARQVVQEMSNTDRSSSSAAPNAMDIADLFKVIVDQGNRSVATFIPPIDSTTGGFERQTLSILAARPSMGKTALLLQIARNVAHSGTPVLFYSLEMSAASLWARVACPLANVSWKDVRNGIIRPEQKHDLMVKSYEMAAQYAENLMIVDTNQTTESIYRSVADRRPGLLLIDHLRLIQDKNDSENKRQGLISERLKTIAKTFNLPVVVAVQLNRGVEGRQDKRPLLSDLRDSGEIEENADLVMMLYRDSYYNQANGKNDKDITELIIRKFRDGESGKAIRMMFNLKQQWFEKTSR